MPQRVNRAIELLEEGQPVYYTGVHDVSYDGGRAMAQTWADYIAVEMEHGAFDMLGLSEFMRGLVDGGPTNSGHRTPAVVITLPLDGSGEDVVRANAWMFRQALARGVHGALLCHAETPEAVRAFVEACRYPFNTAGRRGDAWRGEARRRRPGVRGAGVGTACRGLPGEGRPLAAKSRWRAAPGPEDREPSRVGELRGQRPRARHFVRRVGTGGHGNVPRIRHRGAPLGPRANWRWPSPPLPANPLTRPLPCQHRGRAFSRWRPKGIDKSGVDKPIIPLKWQSRINRRR